MKCIYTLLCFIALSAKSQVSDEPVRLLHYALDSFVSGKVLLKSGAISNQRLNYNLVTQEMIFEDHGTYLAIAHPENVDTVFLGSRKFVPVKNAFYEILTGTTYPLFIAYTCTVKEEGNATGYGNTTTGAATPIRSLETGGMSYKLKLPDGFRVIPIHTYYIRKNGRYIKIQHEQQLVKLFPGKKEALNNFIKNNHIVFSNRQDVIALVQLIQ